MTSFYTLVHPTMHWSRWHLCLVVYRSTLTQHTYLATPELHIAVYKTWSLVCLCKHSLSPLDVTNRFCLHTIKCSDWWCVYIVHRPLTGYDAGHQLCALHSLINYSWILPEWTTVGHSTPHCLTKFPSSPVVWVPHSGRWRRTLSLARWRRMYD